MRWRWSPALSDSLPWIGTEMRVRSLPRNRQTSFDGLPQVETKLLHGLALRGAPGNGRDFGPEPALFRFVDDGVNLHKGTLVEAAGVEPASEKVRDGSLRAYPIRFVRAPPSEPARAAAT